MTWTGLEKINDGGTYPHPTPGCTCASRGLEPSWRHGLACPYGQRRAQHEIAVRRATDPRA